MISKSLSKYVKAGGYEAHYLLAGAASDNVAKDTGTIDRLGFLSAILLVIWRAIAVTDTATLSFTIRRYQSADGTNWDAAETIQAATVAFTAATPTLTGKGSIHIAQDLSELKRYLKYDVIADLSASGTDTAAYSVLCELGGADAIPTA
jgi:hypothetical protein